MEIPNEFHGLPDHTRHTEDALGASRNPVRPRNTLPCPLEIHNRLSEAVIGHNEAKIALGMAVYNHLMRCAMADTGGAKAKSENHVWIAGPSASGKTLLLESLRKIVGIPLLHLDCANLSPHGYKGTTVSHHLDTLSSQLVEDGFTRPAIVVLDEGDKLRSDRSEAGTYRAMVQRDLLQFLGGSACGHDLDLDSSRILCVLCGAFEGLDQLRDRSRVSTIGFQTAVAVPESPSDGQLPPLGPEELIQFGFSREFVGRFSRFVALDPLDAAGMRRILTEAADNPLARKTEFFALHGVTLTFTDDALTEISKMAATRPTGARSLREFIDVPLRGIQQFLPYLATEGVTDVIVDREVVLGAKPPSEIRSEPTSAPESLTKVREAAARYRKSVAPKPSPFDGPD